MYTALTVQQVSKEFPSKWIISTEEDIDIVVEYRYGFIFVKVDDEILHKKKLTSNITDGKMTWDEFLQYADHHLPEEMIDFSTVGKLIT